MKLLADHTVICPFCEHVMDTARLDSPPSVVARLHTRMASHIRSKHLRVAS